MGCHTWSYKKVDRTFEEAIEIAKKNILNIIDYNLDYYKKILSEIDKGIYQFLDEGEIDILTIWDFQDDELNYYDEETKQYYVETEFHDMFRIGGYPEDKLYSYEESLDYIKKYEEKYNIKVEIYGNYLKEFWEKYPDGFIEFG